MLQIFIILVFICLFYMGLQIYLSKKKQISQYEKKYFNKNHNQETIDLTIKLEITNNYDLENSHQQLEKLNEYLEKVSDKESREVLENAILKLNEAISSYETLHDCDNYEGTFNGNIDEAVPYVNDYRLIYKDGSGKITERDISTIRIGEDFNNDIMLLAHCHKRNAKRSFFVSRMLDLIDLETGEVIQDRNAHFPEKIREYFNSPKYKKTIEDQERLEYRDEFIQKNNDLLSIINYIVRADGSFNQKERQIVREYIKNIESNEHLNDEMIDSVMRNIEYISYQAFQARVRKLQDNNFLKIDLLKFASEIASTQKSVSEAEHKIIKYLEKKGL